MRESVAERSTGGPVTDPERLNDPVEIVVTGDAYEPEFFESFYKANLQSGLDDRATIGAVTAVESRFHYNAIENSIIEALVRFEPLPPAQLATAWRMLRQREGFRSLDIGPGAGHWMEFAREILDAKEATGLELTEQVTALLNTKYGDDEAMRVVRGGSLTPELDVQTLGSEFDYITAIGVMFHIISDERWEQAVANLASVLKPGGKLFVGGDFGAATENREGVKTVSFDSWRKFEQAEMKKVFVTRRVRSLAHWIRVAGAHGLEMADLVRTPRHPSITTPENDVLLLTRKG